MPSPKVLIIDPGIRFIYADSHKTGAKSYFPRGAMSITTFLRQNGVNAEFFFLDTLELKKNLQENISLIFTALIEKTKKNKYDLIAIGGPFTLQYPLTKILAEMTRELCPTTHISLGGVHFTFMDKESLEEIKEADSVIRGEGEWTTLELAHILKQKLPISQVQGITYRDGKRIIQNPPRKPGDLRELPIIDYQLVPKDLYKDVMINITASRGCAFSCAFCAERSFWGNKVRFYPIENIIEEIKRISKIIDKPIFSIEDSMISIESIYFKKFCYALNKLPSKDFIISHIMSRIDTISEDGLIALKDSGIFKIQFGVENLSEKVLRMMNKKITRKKVDKALMMTRDHGIFVATLWIFGHPGDDPEQSEINIEALKSFYKKDLHQIAAISLFVPYPGTPIFSNPEKYNITIFSKNWGAWERFSSNRVCELKNYDNNSLLKAFNQAWTIKLQFENFSVMQYFAKYHINTKDNSTEFFIIPTNLGTHIICEEHINKFWNNYSSNSTRSSFGIFYQEKEILIYYNRLLQKDKLKTLIQKITEEIGGIAKEEQNCVKISNTNRVLLNQYAFYEYLHNKAEMTL